VTNDAIDARRVQRANGERVREDRRHVLYWMIAARRSRSNYALERAAGFARALGRPLVVLEALRCDYPFASDRLHRFVLDGMRDNAAAFARAGVAYHPYVEPTKGAGKGLLQALAGDACVVVTDYFPSFFLPRMVRAAARKLDVALETVDSNGVVPLSMAPRTYEAAVHFRRFLHKSAADVLTKMPAEEPLEVELARGDVPAAVAKQWPAFVDHDGALGALPIDHEVAPARMPGGMRAADKALGRFVDRRLSSYLDERALPQADATSRLSPYLHFGHPSVHDAVRAVIAREAWRPSRTRVEKAGAREGFWNMSPEAEAWLDELLTWRELALNGAATAEGADLWPTLPEWARATLTAHAGDRRAHRYGVEELEAAETHDEVWNTAMRQMKDEGWFHNALRMLWGKKILEWSSEPRAALATMARLMDRWSLDGRDPSSCAGYAWTLGRYDRPWPERAIYGRVRSMSSERMAKRMAAELD